MRLVLITFLIGSYSIHSQNTFENAQRKIDLNHCGIGFELFKPKFGNRIRTEKNWVGFNALVDGFETKLSFGEVLLSEPHLGFSDDMGPPIFSGRYAYGGHFSVGGNFPITSLRFGSQNSFINIKRFHPTLNFAIGGYGFSEKSNLNEKDGFYYLGVGTGARLRLPLLTIEPFINFNLGLHSGGGNIDAFKWFSINSGFVFRLDGLKQYLSPSLITVPTTNWQVTSYRSSSYETVHYERRNGADYKVTTTHTTTTADVSVSPGTVGIQDIGPFAGFALKYSMNNFKSNKYMPRGWLAGVGLHARGGLAFMGFNMDIGKIGHGSELQNADARWFKKVSRNDMYGKGTMNTFQTYVDIGMDISPMLLSFLGMIREDDGSATSFFSIIAGYSMGYAHVYNQQFLDPSSADVYKAHAAQINAEEQTYKNDPQLSKGGYLGGWFLGVEVGVVSFRVQGFKYSRAPLANNLYYTLAYRIPAKKSRY